ncbi:RNA polymerase sigma factor [Tautonia marina]|uniref:RNA polymerase sigma factor n=1 Tax=Tautonia marina TaxID=2653855 RepID=UPI001375F8EF|nr:sigma-70 family RNA polymerase sigma factor [Tautonia marina]
MQSLEPKTRISLLRKLSEPSSDPVEWSQFVNSYGPLVLSWCRGKGLQEQDARDVAQEVFLCFARQATRFRYDPSRKFRGYLRRLTHAAWCDWVERHRPWHRGTGDTAVVRLLERIADRDVSAACREAEVDQERLERAMRLVRARVEPRTWDAFRLLALEGLSGEEAAVRLGMKRGSAFAARCKVQRLIRLEIARFEAEGKIEAGGFEASG